jgi:hypothetical protein
LLLGIAAAAPAGAQTESAAPTGRWGVVAGVIMLALVFVAIGAVVKFIDMRRKRESEAVLLQAQLSDTVLREPSLAGLVVTPTADVPFWSGTPATVRLEGRVPSAELREQVVRIVEREASRIRQDVRIVDHLTVVPELHRRVA